MFSSRHKFTWSTGKLDRFTWITLWKLDRGRACNGDGAFVHWYWDRRRRRGTLWSHNPQFHNRFWHLIFSKDYILNDVVSPLLQSSTLEFLHLLRQSLKEGIQVLTDQQSDISKKIVEKISARFEPKWISKPKKPLFINSIRPVQKYCWTI